MMNRLLSVRAFACFHEITQLPFWDMLRFFVLFRAQLTIYTIRATAFNLKIMTFQIDLLSGNENRFSQSERELEW